MDGIAIEELSPALIIGIDLDEDDNLVFSASSSVFHQEAKVKEEISITPAPTLRRSRKEQDQTLVALAVAGKIQEILIGKRVMQHKGWFKLLEPHIRDPKNSPRARVVMVDGPVEEIIRYSPEDKPRLPIYLTKLIETAERRNVSIECRLQDLIRDNYDTGITASLTELRKEGRLTISGTAFVDEDGKYRMSIGPVENMLFRILQHKTKGEFSFTFEAPDQPVDEIFQTNAYSFSAKKITVKTKVGYADDRFTFDVGVRMRVSLTERFFPLDMRRQAGELEQDIARQMEERFGRLIRKFQSARIDPVGFGLYARAYEYRRWKQVEDRWGDAMSKADVNVKVAVTLIDMGLTK